MLVFVVALKLAIGIGIGAFITVVGLKNAGLVVQGDNLGTLGSYPRAPG